MKHYHLKSENEILNKEVRSRIIAEIEDHENVQRKKEQFKRYEVYKDKTNIYVEDLLLKQFDGETVEEMRYAISNISIGRKIIDKLSRVYSNGLERILPKKKDQKNIEQLEKHLHFNTKMKKSNRYLKLHKNILAGVKPIPVIEDGETKYDLKMVVIPPFLFDAIEDFNDKEKPMVIIFSSFSSQQSLLHSISPAQEGRTFNTPGINNQTRGDGQDQIIADTPFDSPEQKKEYIWWSNNYHFTTDMKGNVIDAPDGNLNPIGMLPYVGLAEDQDGHFWSMGGSDLIDGSILINSLITNTNHIGITQGYGQAFMTGKNLPKKVKVGPNHIVQLEQKEGEPNPAFGFANSNPPLADLMQMTRMYTALLLSTNNLSTSGIKVDIQSGQDFPSGIAAIIDKSESVEDVQDQQKIYHDSEPMIWQIIAKWLKIYNDRNLLIKKLAALIFSPDIIAELQLRFNDIRPIITEAEKLDNLAKRKDLGINTMIDLMKIDNPEITDKEAEEKLLVIVKEKLERMQSTIIKGKEDEDNQGDGKPSEDDIDSGLPE